LFADYRRQNKEGVDIMSGAGYTQSSLLPRMLDHSTDQIDAGVQYKLPKGSVTVAYYGSFFSNNIEDMTWDTPFTADPGAEQPSMAQEPDNDFQQVSLSGHYRFDAWDQVLALSLASGRGAQNQDLMPYTVNPNIVTEPLPRSSLDGKVETMNYAVTWTARPFDPLRLKAAYRYDERDNTTAQSEWTRVMVDILNSREAEQNIPYSFKRTRVNLSAEWRLLDAWRLSAGYDYKQLDRDFQEVAEQTEDTGWGQVRWQPSGWLDLRMRGGTAKRDIDRYDTDLAQSFGQNPLMRKYNLAYRYRVFGEFSLAASPENMPLSFGISVFGTDDSYTKSDLGMTDAHEVRVTADVNWAISENASTYLMFGTEGIESRQLGSQQFATADWEATHQDDFDHFGVGIVWRQVSDRLDLTFDYTHGKGNTEIVVSSVSKGFSPLPDLGSTLDSLRLEALFRLNDRMEITSSLRYEQFETDDWALQDVAPDTLPTILTLDAKPYDYDVWAFGLGFRYRFGSRELELAN